MASLIKGEDPNRAMRIVASISLYRKRRKGEAGKEGKEGGGTWN